jgi:hypothetical protein
MVHHRVNKSLTFDRSLRHFNLANITTHSISKITFNITLPVRKRGAVLPLPQYVMTSCLIEQWILFHMSRDSSVGIAIGYGLDNRMIRVRFPAGARNFPL